MNAPHYLRFARALALVSGTLAGCAEAHAPESDAATPPLDAPIAVDAPIGIDAPMVDAGFDAAGLGCGDCVCYFAGDAGPGALDCVAIGLEATCCYDIGPLPPPDLPA